LVFGLPETRQRMDVTSEHKHCGSLPPTPKANTPHMGSQLTHSGLGCWHPAVTLDHATQVRFLHPEPR
jgi:hypothetical protein